MLVTNVVPDEPGTLFLLHTGAIWVTVLICDFYRQRFFLEPRSEWGLHWRSAFVGFVKWPYFVLAFADAIRGRYGIYPITDKMRASTTAVGLSITHATVLVLIGTGWTINFLRGSAEFIPLHIATGFTAITSLAAIVTSLRPFPPPYQSEIRQHWNERQENGRRSQDFRRFSGSEFRK
jgi:hypothetical protein